MLRYKTIVFGIIFYFIFIMEIDDDRKLKRSIEVLLITVFLNILVELIIYTKLPFLFASFIAIANERYVQDLEINMARNRYFVDVHDAALIPILMLYFGKAKNKVIKYSTAALIFLVPVITLLSNFRAQLLVALYSFIASGVVIQKKFVRTVIYFIAIAVLLYVGYAATSLLNGYNALDRLITPEAEDYITLKDRAYYWAQSIGMGLSHPLTGVGLGNFYDYLTNKSIITTSLSDPKNEFLKITWIHPHNIFFGTFAETGFIGLATLIGLLCYMVLYDIKAFLERDAEVKIFIISFWGLFLFSLINPATTLSYTILFWVLRGVIFKLSYST